MTQQDTVHKILNWAQHAFAPPSPSLASATTPATTTTAPADSTASAGGLMSAATPASTTPATSTPAPATSTTTAPTTATPAAPGASTWQSAVGATPYLVSSEDLAQRTTDKPTETVQGQLGTLLAADSPVLQQARADGERTAFDRGLGNSSIAASAGEDSLLRAATGIATSDAGVYGKAGDYNVAAQNQATMSNATQANAFQQAKMQLDANAFDSAAGRAQQAQLATMQDATTKAGQANALTIAQMQDSTTRFGQMDGTSQQNLSVANNIIANMDMSPDRKAALLQELGFGTMSAPGRPGTGLAGAVYVLDSVGADLTGKPTDDQKSTWGTGRTYIPPYSGGGSSNGSDINWGPDAPGYG